MTCTTRTLLFAAALSLAPLPLPAAGPGVSLQQAVAQAVRQTGGQVLAAETEAGPNGPRHRIKLLRPDGRVVVIYVDARR